MSNTLTNGAMFSMFKCADSHTVRGRPTRKCGVVIYERILRDGSFHKLRPSNSHGLTMRLTVWDAILRSHGFASKSRGEPENLEIARKFLKVWRNIE